MDGFQRTNVVDGGEAVSAEGGRGEEGEQREEGGEEGWEKHASRRERDLWFDAVGMYATRSLLSGRCFGVGRGGALSGLCYGKNGGRAKTSVNGACGEAWFFIISLRRLDLCKCAFAFAWRVRP